MKINWNKIVAGVLITNSLARETNAINFNYNPSLKKTFEVAETQTQNFAELGFVNQEFTDIYSVRGPITCPDAAFCTGKLFEQLAICASLSFPPAVALCATGAWAAYYLCMNL